MNELSDLRRMLLRELESFKREVEMCPDDAVLWAVPEGVTNSVGTLAIHVTGNLRHFVGAVLGQTGYVRDRDAEFSIRGLTRAMVVVELDLAIRDVTTTFARLDPAVLENQYPQKVGGVAVGTRRWLIHLAVHLGFHLGQAGYLRRVVTGQNRSTGPVPVPALAEP
jgi:hypothetical protein